MLIETKERFTIPNKYVIELFGSIVKVIGENNNYDLWIQLSKDVGSPDWKKVEFLLEKVFNDLLNNSDFIEECLKIYLGEKDFSNLVKILTEVSETQT